MNQMTLIALHSKSKFCQSEAGHELLLVLPSPPPPPRIGYFISQPNHCYWEINVCRNI